MPADNIIAFPTPPVARQGSRMDRVLDAIASDIAGYLRDHRAGREISLPEMKEEERCKLEAAIEAHRSKPSTTPPVVREHLKRLAAEIGIRARRIVDES